MDNSHPKLRPLDVKPFVQNGQAYLLLRDPLELSDQIVAVPQMLGPALALCDGTRDLTAIVEGVAGEYGFRLGENMIGEMVSALDAAFLLDNEKAAAAKETALAAYRNAEFRPPALAGRSYPDDPESLRQTLRGYLDEIDTLPGAANGRALISPHIDFMRGGSVYAQVWQRARPMIAAADLVVIFGTDHAGSYGHITLTRQHYATPFGVLPTAHNVVDVLAEALGPENVFAEELHHRAEHSIEFAAVWLHYLREEQPCEVLPVLCGSFGHFVEDGATPVADAHITKFIETLQAVTAGRRVIYVAAADLAHVGPAFGGAPLDEQARVQLRASDDDLMQQIHVGDAEGFFAAIKGVQDRNNVCGVAPIYLTLRLTGSVQGEIVAYDQCSADDENTSAVCVCGMLLH